MTVAARDLPIGIFDSGIGGLTVVRQIHKALPQEDLVYLGDTARVPYGTKSPGTVVRFACEDAQFLVGQRVKALVVACNTASAWALPTLEHEFKLPIFGVIQPGAKAAAAKTRNGRIGVIGTNATIRSGAYGRSIHALNHRIRVLARPCPLLVPLVEAGWIRHPVTRAVLREYLAPLVRRGIDTLVLGCTHYPLLKPAIRQAVRKKVMLVDSAQSCAEDVRLGLQHLDLLRGGHSPGWIRPFVTDEPDQFESMASRFLRCRADRPVRVELEGYSLPHWSC